MEKRNAIVEFNITPVGAETRISEAVAACTRIVRESGLENELHAMGTIVEGDLDDCLRVIRECMDTVLADAPRASTSMRIDCGEGRSGIGSRVQSVEDKLG